MKAQASLQLRFGEATSVAKLEINSIVAQWVADHDQVAGMGTDTLPNATALFAPLVGSQSTLGAIGVRANDPERFLDPDQGDCSRPARVLIALSLERDRSVLEAGEAQLRSQTEEMRSSLLSSVSHDLRTPLAAIVAASESLLQDARSVASDDSQRRLVQTIAENPRGWSRLVENLLDMTRLESGAVSLNKEWHVLEEIVGTRRSFTAERTELGDHHCRSISRRLAARLVDGVLIEQVIVNLLDNASRYTPTGSRIEVVARHEGLQLIIRVADDGPGLPPGAETRVFEKFYRAAPQTPDGRRGVGLGLAICRAIVDAHDGRLTAGNRPEGGAEFVIVLPTKEPPPVRRH